MSSVVISGDTSGAITLAAPAVAGTNTITLPASAGTVALTSGLPASSQLAKAWVQFGVSGGTVTINKSYNCSSITRSASGIFTFNFSTTMTDTGYAPVGSSCGTLATNSGAVSVFQTPSTGAVTAPTTSAFIFSTLSSGGGNFDPTYANIVVFGN
jgi:hypothetical protein